MELLIAVGILFGMGYGAGFGVRALSARKAADNLAEQAIHRVARAEGILL